MNRDLLCDYLVVLLVVVAGTDINNDHPLGSYLKNIILSSLIIEHDTCGSCEIVNR